MQPILTDDKGRPFERPEHPEPNASIEDKIAYLNACYLYRNTITNVATTAFAEAFNKSLEADHG